MNLLPDWIIIVGAVLFLGAILVSWLATYQTSQAPPTGAGRWFALPPWAQITAGLAAIVLFTYLGYLLWIPIPLMLSPGTSLILRLGGLILFLAGLSLWFWAHMTLGAMFGVSTGSVAPLQARHRLIQHGAYAIIRHPMYLSYWMVLAGLTLVYRTWALLVFLAMFLSLCRRARREEQALATLFGSEWQAYVAHVPMFMPHWRAKRGRLKKGEKK
ncbi:MAG: methyltransferase family protein [Anaerolineae bacterium]